MVSHPMWVRGLKLESMRTSNEILGSHPMWVRGLKLFSLRLLFGSLRVAPHVGAWIETPCI